MDIDLVCTCGAGIAVNVYDEENTTGIWMLIHRFANAHISCGYMTRTVTEEAPQKSKNIEQ